MPVPCCPDRRDHRQGGQHLRTGALLLAACIVMGPAAMAGPAVPGSPGGRNTARDTVPAAAGPTAQAPGAVRLTAPARGGIAADTLSVFFTAETRGNLEPCACPQNPQGGLARRTWYLHGAAEAVRARGGAALIVDAGGFLPEGEVPLRDDPTVARRLTTLLLDGLARSGVQAVALDRGQRDFLARTAPGETHRLQGALLEADPPGPPRILAWGTHRVAILALEETLTDEQLRDAGATARARGDLVIVLARGDAFSGRRLARLSGANLVLLSRGARPVSPILEGSSTLVGCGIDGKEVGEVRIVLDPGTDGGRAVPRVAGFQLHPMVGTIPADSEVAQSVAALVRDAGPRAFIRNMD
jgi:hypothetical protein